MNYSIYLVEDEENLNSILTSYLQNEGWSVTSFLNGKEAQKEIHNEPHLWILDIMLPDIDGYQLIKEIKGGNELTPVIFISARDADLDKIIGLELGSDDYLAKPFLPRELIIRTKKLLERVYKESPTKLNENKTVLGSYKIDENTREVSLNGEVIELTSKEFDLLVFFINYRSQAFSRDQILERVWGEDYFGNDRVVDDLLRRLRKKLPLLNIETIYGYGYRLAR
ncbi:response regulator transcription factor [Clostridium algoriphilum]|uniref:response regulator transcription factor n=1 Tax=Clostridium algoriphilum TaxID=198347 RepID=UPI001CF353D7|nr:response regulator transcription factor [Clostridium algoriphilum]MCB2294075.1 response regulator transcription factor [Clostridium algoriphilum]